MDTLDTARSQSFCWTRVTSVYGSHLLVFKASIVHLRIFFDKSWFLAILRKFEYHYHNAMFRLKTLKTLKKWIKYYIYTIYYYYTVVSFVLCILQLYNILNYIFRFRKFLQSQNNYDCSWSKHKHTIAIDECV